MTGRVRVEKGELHEEATIGITRALSGPIPAPSFRSIRVGTCSIVLSFEEE